MTDHIQQAATQAAQRDDDVKFKALHERAATAEAQVSRLMGLCIMLAVAVSLTGALAIWGVSRALDYRGAFLPAPRMVLDLRSQLDDARQALDRCVNDLLERPTPHAEWSPTLLNGIRPALTDHPTTLDPPRDCPAELTYDGKRWGVSYQDRHCTLTADGREVDCMPDTEWSDKVWGDSSALTAYCRKTGAGLLDCGTVAK